MEKKKSKEGKGISLIALIVTIIVLVILAGVAIVTLTGENGILERARLAKENTEQKSSEEQGILEGYENEINNYNNNENPRTIDETEYNNIKSKVNDIGKIFTGTVATNSPANASGTVVNSYTVTEKGTYQIYGEIMWNTWYSGSGAQVNIFRNNSHVAGNWFQGTPYGNWTYIPMSISCFSEFEVNDVVNLIVYKEGDSNTLVRNNLKLMKISN